MCLELAYRLVECRTSTVDNNYVLWIFIFQQQELSSKVFAHLCDVVDDNKQFYDEKIHQISKLIILEGKSWKKSQTVI